MATTIGVLCLIAAAFFFGWLLGHIAGVRDANFWLSRFIRSNPPPTQTEAPTHESRNSQPSRN